MDEFRATFTWQEAYNEKFIAVHIYENVYCNNDPCRGDGQNFCGSAGGDLYSLPGETKEKFTDRCYLERKRREI